MQPVVLKIFHREVLLKTKTFTDDQISIGSGEGLSLQLEGLSPWHVLIEKKRNKYYIFDLGSEEGSFLNGKRITGEEELSSGSNLTFGEYKIQFFIGEAQEQDTLPPEAPFEDTSSGVKTTQKKKSTPPKKPAEATFKDFLNQKTKEFAPKPKQKGYWNTFAPASQVKDLDKHLEPSIGNLIEVMVAWKERVISSHHFYQKGEVSIGSDPNCTIKIPNLLGLKSYTFLTIAGGAKVLLNHGVDGVLFQGKDTSTRTSHPIQSAKSVILKPYEMIRLNFKDTLRVYVRIMEKKKQPPLVGLFRLKPSESTSLFLAMLFTALLVFYAGFYGPAFLLEDQKFLEKNIRVASIKFDKVPSQVVDYKLGKKTKQARQAQKVTRVKKKKTIRIPVKKKRTQKVTRVNIPKKGKSAGKVGAQAPGKKRIKKRVSVGTVRPGGSLKTGKKGASARTKAPDPTKVGLLGVFGGGGALNKLDKGASGSGGLVGLAQDSTGYAGTEESYKGQGVGTRTKNLGSGGEGASLVGISGVKTKGRGGSVAGVGEGGLGSRGRMNIEFGEDDIDIEGEIDRAGILRVIRANKVRFDNCYQRSLQQDSSIQGALKMQWNILPNGSVRAVSALEDAVGSSSLIRCVSETLKDLNFPAPPSGQIPRIAFKFVFSI